MLYIYHAFSSSSCRWLTTRTVRSAWGIKLSSPVPAESRRLEPSLQEGGEGVCDPGGGGGGGGVCGGPPVERCAPLSGFLGPGDSGG